MKKTKCFESDARNLFFFHFRKDSYGNTALHYAKSYPDQSIVKFLLTQVKTLMARKVLGGLA